MTQYADIKYRPDIDGLRGVAVLLVLGFHFFPLFMPAGFVGVDVFFVISGYLITNIIVTNIRGGSFGFFEFYSRRIRRIFPALTLILLVTLILGWGLSTREEYMQTGMHVKGAALFVTNIFLMRENGYFDAASNSKPLLHLWSLAIEEQFYVIWPLLVVVITKVRQNLSAWLLFMWGVSFLVCLDLTRTSQIAAFYMPYSRFWELLTGSLLAVNSMSAAIMPRRFVAPGSSLKQKIYTLWGSCKGWGLSLSGLLLLAYGLFRIPNELLFPGWGAAIPVFAAAALIAAGPEAVINKRLLSSVLLVRVGLISYPLYLWHWVLLVYARYLSGGEPGLVLVLIVIVASFLLAVATYQFIEKPARAKKFNRYKVALLCVCMIALGSVGNLVQKMEGVSKRSWPRPQSRFIGDVGNLEFHKYIFSRFHPCVEVQASFGDPNQIRCAQSKPAGPATVAIIGDSHAEHLLPGLGAVLSNDNVLAFTAGMFPVYSNEVHRPVFDKVIASSQVRVVVLSAFWAATQGGFTDSLALKLADTIQKLEAAGKIVIVVADGPYFSFDARLCKYPPALDADGYKCSESEGYFLGSYNQYIDYLKLAAGKSRSARLFYTAPLLCGGGACSMVKDGVLLFRDKNHLNTKGSVFMARYLSRLIDDRYHPDLVVGGFPSK